MKTVIEMAKKAGFERDEMDTHWACHRHEIEAFAALVRAEAQAEEREACAKVCEELGMATNGMYERNHECAAAIRARGNT